MVLYLHSPFPPMPFGKSGPPAVVMTMRQVWCTWLACTHTKYAHLAWQSTSAASVKKKEKYKELKAKAKAANKKERAKKIQNKNQKHRYSALSPELWWDFQSHGGGLYCPPCFEISRNVQIIRSWLGDGWWCHHPFPSEQGHWTQFKGQAPKVPYWDCSLRRPLSPETCCGRRVLQVDKEKMSVSRITNAHAAKLKKNFGYWQNQTRQLTFAEMKKPKDVPILHTTIEASRTIHDFHGRYYFFKYYFGEYFFKNDFFCQFWTGVRSSW